MSLKYRTTLDLNNRNNSHTLIVEFVGRDKDVLEVGTATGYVSRALVDNGCRVTGIEIDAEAAKLAAEVCARTVVGDVERLDLKKELGGETFDVIVFGDVLEHLKDPLEALRRLKPFLRAGGYVVASIPNVAHGSVRLALMQGKFRYKNLGLLDETHLRFFTRESVEKLFNDAGFFIGKLDRTTVGIFDSEIEVDRESIPPSVIEEILVDPEAETYQFILAAHASGDTDALTALLKEQLAWRDNLIFYLGRRLRNMEEVQQRLANYKALLEEKEHLISGLRQRVAERNSQLAQDQRTINRLNNRLNRR